MPGGSRGVAGSYSVLKLLLPSRAVEALSEESTFTKAGHVSNRGCCSGRSGHVSNRSCCSGRSFIDDNKYPSHEFSKEWWENQCRKHLKQLDQPVSAATYAFLLRSCGNAKALSEGKRVHAHMVKTGYGRETFSGNFLVQMYGKCGDLRNARLVFDEMHRRNVFSWTIMIGAYAQQGQRNEAFQLFQQMYGEGVVPNKVTFLCMLSACASHAVLAVGKLIHARIRGSGFESDIVVCNSLVNMYGKCGSMDDARRMFDTMPKRDVFSWTAMIAVYAQHEQGKEVLQLYIEALKLFHQMQVEGVIPNKVTFITILDACANQAALTEGKRTHFRIVNSGFESDVTVRNALINMYGKCGTLEDARRIFDKMSKRDMVSWTAMIASYAQNGEGKEALQLFRQMQREGMIVDRVTFLTILSACRNAGLLDEGCHSFVSMICDHSIAPTVEHYNCMIDLLGRAGWLDEGEDLISNMQLEPSLSSWMALLGACRMHRDVDRANWAAERAFEGDFGIAAPYVLLSNIYIAAGRWEDAAKIRETMEIKGLKKQPGRSSIELNNIMHEFFAGDESHPQKQEINAELQRLSRQMKDAGYVPDTKVVLHDVDEEEKEHMLCHHSEKVAIAFGLINMQPGISIRVIKNLRVCSDCHCATKFISKITNREIIVRDASRFHHFKEGICSCADYW